jgi:hypothetical protein
LCYLYHTFTLYEHNLVFNSDLHVVRPGYHTPPHLEGRTALYILRQAGRFYVGETDAIRQRLERHRARLERVPGNNSSSSSSSSSSSATGVVPARVEALVLAAANKSAARALGKQ